MHLVTETSFLHDRNFNAALYTKEASRSRYLLGEQIMRQ